MPTRIGISRSSQRRFSLPLFTSDGFHIPPLKPLFTSVALWVSVVLIVLMEVVVFNLGFWMSLPQHLNPPVTQVHFTRGSGMINNQEGLSLEGEEGKDVYLITDPAQAYIQSAVTSDNPRAIHSIKMLTVPQVPSYWPQQNFTYRPWVRAIVEVLPQSHLSTYRNAIKNSPLPGIPSDQEGNIVHIDRTLGQYRSQSFADILAKDQSQGWVIGPEQKYEPFVKNSGYLSLPHTDGPIIAVRVRFIEPQGTTFSYSGAEANVPQNFHISFEQIWVMVLVAAFILAFSARSRLWRTPLNTRATWQQCLIILAALPFIIELLQAIILNPWEHPGGLPVQYPGTYSYDMDQYNRLAHSLLQGHPWLDLPVSHEFASMPNPYDVQARDTLIAHGMNNIFWDHAFWKGRWYVYFGVLPAILFFVPFRFISSFFVPGGLWLPTATACYICLVAAIVGSTLLVVRFVKKYTAQPSVAFTALCVIGFQLAMQLCVLGMRTTFYELPIDLALALVTFGLWFWLGAEKTDSHGNTYLSIGHLIAGSLFIGLTLGCRPVFIAAYLLAFPIFWSSIKKGQFFSYFQPFYWKDKHPFKSWKNDLSIILTAIISMAPFLAYNYWRFGKFLDFGNLYQITVNDLVYYRFPWKDLPYLLYYYLLQPWHLTEHFPLIGPLNTWLPSYQYTEGWPGGLFWTVPFICIGIVGLCMGKTLKKSGLLGFSWLCLILGVVICIIDSAAGGLAMRYSADFGIYFGFVALGGMVALRQWSLKSLFSHKSSKFAKNSSSDYQSAVNDAQSQGIAPMGQTEIIHGNKEVLITTPILIFRTIVSWLVGASICLAVMMYAMPGRQTSLEQAHPLYAFRITADWTNWLFALKNGV